MRRRWRKIRWGRSGRTKGSSFRIYPTYSVRARKDLSSSIGRNPHFRARPTFKPQPAPRGSPRRKKSPHILIPHLLCPNQVSNNFSHNLPHPNPKSLWIRTSSAILIATSLSSTTTKRKPLANSSKKQSSINTHPRTKDNSEGQCNCLLPSTKNQMISMSPGPNTPNCWTTSTKR